MPCWPGSASTAPTGSPTPAGSDTSSSVGLGVDTDNPPAWLPTHFMGLHLVAMVVGPSVAMCAIIALAVWTTAGTFMLLFLAALQDIPEDVEEAARWTAPRLAALPRGHPAGAQARPCSW